MCLKRCKYVGDKQNYRLFDPFGLDLLCYCELFL